MAYDSKTYGQSPFGNSKKPDGPKDPTKKPVESASANSAVPSTAQPRSLASPIDDGPDDGPDDGLDQGPSEFPAPAKPAIPASVTQLASRLGLGRAVETALDKGAVQDTDTGTGGSSARQSRTTTSVAAKTSTNKSTKSRRKSKKDKAADRAQAEAEAAEAAIAQRFQAENRSAYLSLLYKTGISTLVWAVLRLSRHELSDDAIRLINIIIHPLLIATLALAAVVGLTFWLRQLVNDLAYHTRQLTEDAEVSEGKNYRPTLEIVGDSLEYNPKLRRNLALFFDAASILICTLISYLITSALLP